VLTPIVATDDPYQAAAVFAKAGWSLVFQTPPGSGDPLACVDLAGARLMLGTSLPQFLPAESRPHKGAGIEFHLTVPAEDIGAVYEAHRQHADSVTGLAAALGGAGLPRRPARLPVPDRGRAGRPAIRYRKLTGLAHAHGGLIPGTQIYLCGAEGRPGSPAMLGRPGGRGSAWGISPAA
jgi:hypothetical protein